ncbi:hypothetical protein CSW98_17215 [Vibrio sp. HA2012]|nr:hypothetical protein CSW98_17215 [Vibrio sp. HA2012]
MHNVLILFYFYRKSPISLICNPFHIIADFLILANIYCVRRILTRNRKAPRIGNLQEEDSVIQDG